MHPLHGKPISSDFSDRLALGGLVVARLLDQEGPARTPPSSPCRRRALLTGISSIGIRIVPDTAIIRKQTNSVKNIPGALHSVTLKNIILRAGGRQNFSKIIAFQIRYIKN